MADEIAEGERFSECKNGRRCDFHPRGDEGRFEREARHVMEGAGGTSGVGIEPWMEDKRLTKTYIDGFCSKQKKKKKKQKEEEDESGVRRSSTFYGKGRRVMGMGLVFNENDEFAIGWFYSWTVLT